MRVTFTPEKAPNPLAMPHVIRPKGPDPQCPNNDGAGLAVLIMAPDQSTQVAAEPDQTRLERRQRIAVGGAKGRVIKLPPNTST